jgi:predicted transcriptional regulator
MPRRKTESEKRAERQMTLMQRANLVCDTVRKYGRIRIEKLARVTGLSPYQIVVAWRAVEDDIQDIGFTEDGWFFVLSKYRKQAKEEAEKAEKLKEVEE